MTQNQNNKTTTYTDDKTSWKEGPILGFKGFLIGAADIVPGVSGGTVALITGVYDRLISAIRSFDTVVLKRLVKGDLKGVTERIHWKFLLLLVAGIGLAIAFFTRVVPLHIYMFTHPELIFGLFFGLIIGSVILLILEVHPAERNWRILFPILAGALLGFWLVSLVPTDTPETFGFVFLSGAIAISATLLPGISGSYLLLIFRKYDYILAQLAGIGGSETMSALLNLLPFVLGLGTGLILFSRVLSWLLKNYHTLTLVFFIGFLIGSIYILWPFQVREFQETETGREIYSYNDPYVDSLPDEAETSLLPEYEIATDVINPEDRMEDWKVEVVQMNRKVVSSEPVWPGIKSEEHNLKQGGVGVLLGMVLLGLISVLRRKG